MSASIGGCFDLLPSIMCLLLPGKDSLAPSYLCWVFATGHRDLLSNGRDSANDQASLDLLPSSMGPLEDACGESGEDPHTCSIPNPL
jgi:hypothetical protein